MTMKPRFEQLIRVTDSLIGPHIPEQPDREWPDADELGITPANTVEWEWDDHNVYARWFEDDDRMELLVVVTNVDPGTDVGEIEASLSEEMPDSLEIDSAETEYGPALMLAYGCDAYSDLSDEALASELRELFDVVRMLTATVSR